MSDKLKTSCRHFLLACKAGSLAICLAACANDDGVAPAQSSAMHKLSPHRSDGQNDLAPLSGLASKVRAADPVVLARAGNTNPTAARDLSGLHNLCGGIEIRVSKGGALPAEWRPYEQACVQLAPSIQNSLVVEVRPSDHPDSRRLAALSALPEDDPEREQGLESVMRTSTIPEFRMEAAFSMLDGKRLREWGGDVLPSPNLDNANVLQTDAMLLYGCRMGTDCSPDAFFSLGECAQTLTCTPGASLQRVIELRRSPAEMQVLNNVVDRLVQISGE